MTKWKKTPKSRGSRPNIIPTTKLCIDCKQINTRKSDRCTACEMYYKRTRNKRSVQDAIYERELRKHKHLEVV